jgi:hypothetical protein
MESTEPAATTAPPPSPQEGADVPSSGSPNPEMTGNVGSHDASNVEQPPEFRGELPFSTSKPRHAADGFAKGASNILTGALAGAALLVSAPIAGAYEAARRVVLGVLLKDLEKV